MGPGGIGTLLLLAIGFAGALLLVARQGPLALRLIASLLAFLCGAVFGISAVNRYFDYYQSWSALLADLGADNGTPALPVTIPRHGLPTAAPPTPDPGLAVSPAAWSVHRLALPGARSGVHGRSGMVLLPPGYRAAVSARRLPVLVLLHGEPGTPYGTVQGLHLAKVLGQVAAENRLGPMALVLPDVRGLRNQQCLDVRPGAALQTYLIQDVPADLQDVLPVAAPGQGWVVAGLSEGGYCAADLALNAPSVYGAAAVLDGYFHPDLTGGMGRRAFHGSQVLEAQHNPTDRVRSWPTNRPLPPFWVMGGTANARDYDAAVAFALLLSHRSDPRFLTVEGGRHTTPAWRAALPDLLAWSWRTATGHPYGGSATVPV